tara:strand:- start:334 stop:855 length:522 start_codon:yes stop_codon:yes gene_type:complete
MKTASKHKPAAAIAPDLLALMVKGVSVIVGACGLDLRPSLMRAMGSAVDADGHTVTVYLSRSQSRELLQDIASTGRLAVVFTQPHSHRAVQLKAGHARIRSADVSDAPALARYVASMEEELALIGFGTDFTRTLFSQPLEDMVAVSFEPEEAFDQTPGPKAGAPLGKRRQAAA